MDDDLEWIERWYSKRCDGRWEHRSGITLETTDNPGWWLKIDVAQGADKPGDNVILTQRGSATDWIVCETKQGKFHGAGDPSKLRAILKEFREWAVANNV